jgi:hypothetical protein
LESQLDEFLAKMREARQRVGSWKVQDDGFSAVERGLLKTYRRGRKALRKAYDDPSTENFHEWRKRVKYHWYHARLLRSIWDDVLRVHCRGADALGDLLGNDHDLAVLRATLLEDPHQFGRESDQQALLSLIDRRRAELQAKARPLGQRLFAEKPRRLAERFRSYWKAWRA